MVSVCRYATVRIITADSLSTMEVATESNLDYTSADIGVNDNSIYIIHCT